MERRRLDPSEVTVRSWTPWEALVNHTIVWRAARGANPDLAGLIWMEMRVQARRCVQLGRDPVELARRLGLSAADVDQLLAARGKEKPS